MIAFSNSSVPSSLVFSPTFKFFSIPTPPSTTNAPVSLFPDCVLSLISVGPHTLSLFAIPTPPLTTTEPFSHSVESVVFSKVATPST